MCRNCFVTWSTNQNASPSWVVQLRVRCGQHEIAAFFFSDVGVCIRQFQYTGAINKHNFHNTGCGNWQIIRFFMSLSTGPSFWRVGFRDWLKNTSCQDYLLATLQSKVFVWSVCDVAAIHLQQFLWFFIGTTQLLLGQAVCENQPSLTWKPLALAKSCLAHQQQNLCMHKASCCWPAFSCFQMCIRVHRLGSFLPLAEFDLQRFNPRSLSEVFAT